MPTRPKTKPKTTAAKPKTDPAKVHPKPQSRICVGKSSLTVEQAKELLGWTEEGENTKFKDDFFIRDYNGVKVRSTRNQLNRPFYSTIMLSYVQDILRRKWKWNGEPIIIGEYGNILDGQHRLAALVWAHQVWEKHGGTWKDYWQTAPTLETTLTFGVPEDDETVNSINTGKPRSLTDVLYRSPYFAEKPKAERKQAASILDSAIRYLWRRTQASQNILSARRTHAEALDWLSRHNTLLKCVEHIYIENGDNTIKRWLPLGTATGLMYLMACSTTGVEEEGDEIAYYKATEHSETSCDFSMYDRASDFFVELGNSSETFKALREAVAHLLNEERLVSTAEREALIIKAWNAWSVDQPVTSDTLKLKYDIGDDGFPVLVDQPIVGGIDLGDGA